MVLQAGGSFRVATAYDERELEIRWKIANLLITLSEDIDVVPLPNGIPKMSLNVECRLFLSAEQASSQESAVS